MDDEADADFDDSSSAELRHPWLMWAQLALTAVLVLVIVVLAVLDDVSVGAPFVFVLFALLTATSVYGVTLKRR